jgi:hypothetical protein
MKTQHYQTLMVVYSGRHDRIIFVTENRLTSKLWTHIFSKNEDIIVLGEL